MRSDIGLAPLYKVSRAAWQMEQHGSIQAVGQPLSSYSSADCRFIDNDMSPMSLLLAPQRAMFCVTSNY
jgi:hypothetical protein